MLVRAVLGHHQATLASSGPVRAACRWEGSEWTGITPVPGLCLARPTGPSPLLSASSLSLYGSQSRRELAGFLEWDTEAEKRRLSFSGWTPALVWQLQPGWPRPAWRLSLEVVSRMLGWAGLSLQVGHPSGALTLPPAGL